MSSPLGIPYFLSSIFGRFMTFYGSLQTSMYNNLNTKMWIWKNQALGMVSLVDSSNFVVVVGPGVQ